jgi:hypothetical protein
VSFAQPQLVPINALLVSWPLLTRSRLAGTYPGI